MAGVAIAAYFLYFFRLDGTGLVGPDEPRYASIGRAMARSGDWITPRLWGEAWFEKPALLYWMSGAGFRAGLGDELAPRLPVALLGALFLVFFYWSLKQEFGGRAAAYSTAMLGGSAGWVAFSYASTPDMPMTVFFSAAMLLGLSWLRTDDTRWLTAAAASLGIAVLAKGLVPLALAIPFAWHARSKFRTLLRWQGILAFLLVALPWYALCYSRNGMPFFQKLIGEHHFGRFFSPDLQHVQPVWYYLPVMAASLFPWTPVYALAFRRGFYTDSRRVFLLLWLGFGLVLFSASMNKLHGYILPLLPAAAALGGIALAEARRARAVLAISAGLLCLVFPLASILPRALASGLSRADFPVWSFWWALPVGLAAIVWRLERPAAVALIFAALGCGVIFLKLAAFRGIDSTASARELWRRIEPSRDRVCVEQIHRNWRYGLNYYAVDPLPECDAAPQPIHVVEGDAGVSLTGAPQPL